MTNTGDVVRAGAMVRIVESKRWVPERLELLHTPPHDATTSTYDLTEDGPKAQRRIATRQNSRPNRSRSLASTTKTLNGYET